MHQISCQSIEYVLGNFSLDQSGELVDQQTGIAIQRVTQHATSVAYSEHYCLVRRNQSGIANLS